MGGLVSLTYALKSIRRNFRRSITLMIGVIISLAIVSGVLFYLDSTTGTLVTKTFEEVSIDVAISQETADETVMRELKQFCELNLSESVSSVELIAGSNPFFIRSGGVVVASHSQYVVDLESFRSNEANYTTTFVFGIDPTYMEDFPLFSSTINISEIFANDEVLVSSELADYLGSSETFNVSFVKSELNIQQRQFILETLQSANLTIGGQITFDSSIIVDSIYAFYPELLESGISIPTSFAVTSNCILMSYSKYLQLLNGTASGAIDFNSVHLKVDHSQISLDTSVAFSQLNQITSLINVYYPETTVMNLLELSLSLVEDQLNQMRLFLIYFALPGLLLGGFIFKYAIDLNIEERTREIGILRTKAALRRQIAMSIGIESTIISFIGLVLGILVGYGTSLVISNWLDSSVGFIQINTTSLILSFGIGAMIAIVAAFLSTRQLLSPSVAKSVKANKEDRPSLWRRIYLDFILLGIVLVIYILNIFGFNPIPGFAVAIYDFLAPVLTWLGLTLLLVRGLEKILRSLERTITKIYRIIFRDLSEIITKNILFKPQRITKITIVLSLALSFGLVIAIINETYQQGAMDDVAYQVGSDLRIQLPGSDYITYNSSDLREELINTFSSEIIEITSVYQAQVNFGSVNLLTIGIEPETFFDVCMVKDSFLYSASLENTKSALLEMNDGSYNNLVFSEGLASPQLGISGRVGTQIQQQLPTFNIGDELPIRFGPNQTTIHIVDIASHFPAISDLTGRSEQELVFTACNVEFLRNPISSSNLTLLSNDNASLFFIKANQGGLEELAVSIENWYAETYPNSAELLITTVDEVFEEYSPLLSSLTGLTSMEFILVLAVSSLGLEIFLTSSLYERKREFGTYFAIGGSITDVRKLVLGEISLVTIFSIITGIALSMIISSMYLGFVSDLLILEIFSIVLPYVYMVLLVALVLLSMALAMFLSSRKLSRLDPASILRTV